MTNSTYNPSSIFLILLYYSSQRKVSNDNTYNKNVQKVDENSNVLNSSIGTDHDIDLKNVSSLLLQTTMPNEYEKYIIPSLCIIKIEPLSDDNEHCLFNGDSIQQISVDDMDSSVMNKTSSSTIRSTQLDAIVEDSNEDNLDDLEEPMQPVR